MKKEIRKCNEPKLTQGLRSWRKAQRRERRRRRRRGGGSPRLTLEVSSLLAFKTEPLEHILHHYLNFRIRLGWDAKIHNQLCSGPQAGSFVHVAGMGLKYCCSTMQKNVVANFVQTLFTDRDGEMKTTGMAAEGGNSTDPQTNQEPSFL